MQVEFRSAIKGRPSEHMPIPEFPQGKLSLSHNDSRGGWVCGESDDDGVSRHTHSASGRVMLGVRSPNNKEDKDDDDDEQKSYPKMPWT